MRREPDPRPPRRIRDPEAGLAKLHEEGRCRVCPSVTGLTRHHLVPRSLGGDDVDDNLIPLCFRCHDEYEAARYRAKEIGRTLTKREIGYVLLRKGPRFMARYYGAG